MATYIPPSPPDVNGVMSFVQMYQADGITPNPSYDATKVSTILKALQAIQTGFVPTASQTVCDTFYLTATYNQQNPSSPINGDTCQAILASTGV